MKAFEKWWYDYNRKPLSDSEYTIFQDIWKAALTWVLSIKTELNQDIKLEDGSIIRIRDIRSEWKKRRDIIEKELKNKVEKKSSFVSTTHDLLGEKI